jgi:hypothetical protein
MNVSFTHTNFLHSLHQLVRPYASVEQVHVFLAGTSSCPARVATSSLYCCKHVHNESEISFTFTRAGTLIVATIYLQLIQNRYMFRSFTVLQLVG